VMEGMVELGEEVMGLPVRLGQPCRVGGLADVVRSPKYSTAVGLVLFGAEQEVSRVQVRRDSTSGSRFGSIGNRIGDWFREIF
jgi:cell division protein FtsA